MEIEVNYLAIILASVASLIIGSVWYSKVAFGEAWMQMVGLTKVTAKAKMVPAVVTMFLLSLVMGYILSHVTYMSMSVLGYPAQVAGLSSAFMMWGGFVVPTILGTGLFEQRRKKLLLINLGNWLVTLLAMGAVIGYFGF